MMPLAQKRITAEVCVHHLHFTADDYAKLGYAIKCNPAIKAPPNKKALWQALLDDRLDVIATDHAPHTMEEKGLVRNAAGKLFIGSNEEGSYERSHAGLPLVQHSMLLMLHYVQQGLLSIEKVAEKMSHAVATCFQVADRGFIREGYWADLVIADMNKPYQVQQNNLLYKCGWSPLEGFTFPATIEKTFVNGNIVYENGAVTESGIGMRMKFKRGFKS
jgi:dihydroorotase